MLSTLELERLTDADVGRCLNDTTGLIGRVRMEARPILRVVVEFTVPVGAPGQEQELRAGIWPDRSLTEIRQNAERMRQSVRIQEPSLATTSAQALYQGRARTTVTIRPIPRPAAHAGLGPLFEGIAATDHRTPTRPFLRVVDVFERWVHEALAARKDRGESVRRSMLKDVLPELGELTANTVRRHQIVAVLERIVARGSARQAGCVLADLRQMFRWAAQAAMLDNDPTALMRKSDFGGAAQVRRRHLSTVELHELAAKMSEARLARHVRHGIWLMLATGVRIGELAMARWQDIDIQQRTWTIPAQHSHSGQKHIVALSDFAMRHLQPEGEPARSQEWVFPGRYPSEPLSPKALGKQIRDRQRGTQIRGRASDTTSLLLAGGAWTPLDLRRTTASLLAELGNRPEVVAACLDQSRRSGKPRTQKPGTGIMDDQRAAFEQLGAYLATIELDHQKPGRRRKRHQ